MRIIMLAAILFGLGWPAQASEPVSLELEKVSTDSDPHFGFIPFFSGGPKKEGLPAGRRIPELQASEASHYRLPLRGAQETVFLIWRNNDESAKAWLLTEKGEDFSLEALRMEPDELMSGIQALSATKSFQLNTPEGETLRADAKISLASNGATVYFQGLDARKGKVSLGGREMAIGIMRQPGSGVFKMGSGARILLDLNQDGEFTSYTQLKGGTLRFGEGFPLDKPFLVNGEPYRASGITPDGTRLQVEPATLEPTVARGFEMPELDVELLDGGRLALSQLRGKTVVLNWWFTTCSPCLTEMPGLNQMAQHYSERDDVVFVAIANNDRETLQAFLKDTPFVFRQALADDDAISLMGRGFPRHLIIDQTGRIALDRRGGSKTVHELLEAVLEKVLAES